MGRSRRRGSLTYYRHDLALVHHLGFGFNADATAPGILALLEPLRGGRVLELGCGSVPALLAEHGVQARVAESFGDEDVPDGLAAIIGRKDDA